MGMPKYDRLLYILNLLRTRRSLNAESLARECGVTERTISRDIISLSEANIPIYYDRGYKLASDNFLPPLNFNFDEYKCLKLALKSSPLNKAGDYAEVLKRVRAKVESVLSQRVKDMKKVAADTTHIDISSTHEPSSGEKFFKVIELAISEDTSLDIAYDSINSGLTKRRVDPYFIVYRSRAFYVVAFCHLRGDFRTFRLDRLKHADLTQNRFVRQPGVNAEKYFEGSWSVFSGEPVEVLVRFTGNSARVIQGSIHHVNEEIEETPSGDILYRITVRGTEEIKRWLLGFAEDVEVIKPESLKEEMYKIGENLMKQYNKD